MAGGSKLQQLSPAEFFAKHQNIAGFDNPGKSLYTTIREFVENSLDAAEAIGALPDVEVSVERLSQEQFDHLRGVSAATRTDESLYADAPEEEPPASQSGVKTTGRKRKLSDDLSGTSQKDGKFRVICKDNGAGMPHAEIPNMLAIVLSSTKYGVKQTRGKYGLGAKMALVWSKKSTGMPIEVWSSCDPESPRMSYCVLDIDIGRNRPRILKHEWVPKAVPGWRGTRISVIIGGRWSAYRARIANYFRHLAVITPYADLRLGYLDGRGKAILPSRSAGGSKTRKDEEDDPFDLSADDDDDDIWMQEDFEDTQPENSHREIPREWNWSNYDWSFKLKFRRRSDRIPPPPVEVPHHPSSLDHQLLESLLQRTRANTLQQFLHKDLSNISRNHAVRLIEELGSKWTPDMRPSSLNSTQIHQLARLLQKAKFTPPSGKCLSPAGEYNLRLGVEQVIQPELVATASSKTEAHGGHPFIVEAAVSIGGSDRIKPGLTVYRFANRIPLLFEAGSDVCTIVANKRVRWGSYKIKSTDKVGVFVSIVSTKIPFKGTSKEYIGDDNDVMQRVIRNCIQKCCVQLRKKITLTQSEKNRNQRKKTLSQYIPNVAQSLLAVLRSAQEDGVGIFGAQNSNPSPQLEEEERARLAEKLKTGELTQATLESKLKEYVARVDAEAAQEYKSLQGAKADRVKLFFPPLHPRVSAFNQVLQLFLASPEFASLKKSSASGEKSADESESEVEMGPPRKRTKLSAADAKIRELGESHDVAMLYHPELKLRFVLFQ